jgi:uncharacterized membrane protein
MLRLLVGFLPWIIFGVLGNRSFLLALGLALTVALVATVRQLLRHSLKILDTVTLAFFVFVAICVVGLRWMILATYMSLLVNVTLMAIAWGSLLAGMPFTIQYAREQVAPEFWHTPLFIRINQYITAVWGLDFFLSGLVSVYRHVSGDAGLASQYASLVFSLCALVFTLRFPDWYRARALRVTPDPNGPEKTKGALPP